MLKKLIREDFKLSRPRQDHSIPFAFQIIGKYYSTNRDNAKMRKPNILKCNCHPSKKKCF